MNVDTGGDRCSNELEIDLLLAPALSFRIERFREDGLLFRKSTTGRRIASVFGRICPSLRERRWAPEADIREAVKQIEPERRADGDGDRAQK